MKVKADMTRDKIESGAGIIIEGKKPVEGNSLAIEFGNNERQTATIVKATETTLTLDVEGTAYTLKKWSDGDPLPEYPETATKWTFD
jgi:hypothetical protein